MNYSKSYPSNWIKNFIINLSFVRKDLNGAYKQGGIDSFPLAQKDILETMRDDLDKQAEELAKKKLNDLLSPIDLTNIITLNKQGGIIYIGGEKADEGTLGNLKQEAEYFAQTRLWKLLIETPKALAEKAMFVSGEGLDDLKKGRSILYTLSSQKNVVDILKAYSPRKPLAPTIGDSV